MNDRRILITHAEASSRALISSMLQALGASLEEVDNDPAAVKRLERGGVDLLVAGVDPEHPEALELLLYVRRKYPKLPVILLFSVGHAERHREATQRGAAAVLRFPLPATQLRAAVSQALGISPQHLRSIASPPEDGSAPPMTYSNADGWTVLNNGVNSPARPVSTLPVETDREFETPLVIGEDDSLRHAVEVGETIAPTRTPVLIQGERGCGKSLVARALHGRSPRRSGPFVELRCASSYGTELVSELFGSVEPDGTFKPGLLARASGGTLYLDDVAKLSPDLQARLLRLLRDGDYEPVGSTQSQRADVRLVFATREDLAERVATDQFRQDLYYRLSVVRLVIPPLRHRVADIERLADHFRVQAIRKNGRHEIVGISAEALSQLRRYHWPGNVLELESVIDRAVLLGNGPLLEPSDLRFLHDVGSDEPGAGNSNGQENPSNSSSLRIRPLKEALEEPERQIILDALEALDWNRQETARLLDINRTTLYKKMKKYNLIESYGSIRETAHS